MIEFDDILKVLCNKAIFPNLFFHEELNSKLLYKCLNKDDGIDIIFSKLDKIQSDGSLYSLSSNLENIKLFKKDKKVHHELITDNLKLLFNSSNDFEAFKELNLNAICNSLEINDNNDYTYTHIGILNKTLDNYTLIAYYNIYKYYYE